MTSEPRRSRIRFAARRWGQAALVAVLALLLIALAVVQGTPQTERPFDLASRGPQGLLALRLWLAELGYRVQETGTRRFELPPAADLLFIYPGERPYSAVDAAIVRHWVEQGGTLVLVGPAAQDEALVDALGVGAAPAISFGIQASQAQPLLPDAPAAWPVLDAGRTLELGEHSRVVPVITVGDSQVSAAVQAVGDGVVWHLSPLHSLVNAQLADRNQATLAPALLRLVPDGGLVLFDTYHLAAAAPESSIATVRDWLYRTPVGRGVLLATCLVIGFLFQQGRRLGPPLPNGAESRRREAAEYVRAMAALYRRSRQRPAIARHQKRRLKQGVGRPLRIAPDLPDDEFMAHLARAAHRHTERDVDAMATLLQRLDREQDERDLVLAAQEVDRLLAQASPSIHRTEK